MGTTTSGACELELCKTMHGGWQVACENWYCRGCSQCPYTTTTEVRSTTSNTNMTSTTQATTTNSTTTSVQCYMDMCSSFQGGWQEACNQWFCASCVQCPYIATTTLTNMTTPSSTTTTSGQCYPRLCGDTYGGWERACENWFCSGCPQCPITTTTTTTNTTSTTITTTVACWELVCSNFGRGWHDACNQWFCKSCQQCPFTTSTTSRSPNATVSTSTTSTSTSTLGECYPTICSTMQGGWQVACENWYCGGCSQCPYTTTTGTSSITTSRNTNMSNTTSTSQATSTNATTTTAQCYMTLCPTLSGGWQDACNRWFCASCAQCPYTTSTSTSSTTTPPTTTTTTGQCRSALCGSTFGGWKLACENWFCSGCTQCPFTTTTTTSNTTSTTTTTTVDCVDQLCSTFAGGWENACSQWFCASCPQCPPTTASALTNTTTGAPTTTFTTTSGACELELCKTMHGGWQVACENWYCRGCSQCPYTTTTGSITISNPAIANVSSTTKGTAVNSTTTHGQCYGVLCASFGAGWGQACDQWFCASCP